jgi:N-terminal domain of (some) glycogen debranching enzymes
VLVCEESGEIIWPSEKGLYFLDTRVVSGWRIYANGISWQLLNGGAMSYSTARTFLTNRSIPTENGTIPPRTLGLSIGRSITGGLPTKAV